MKANLLLLCAGWLVTACSWHSAEPPKPKATLASVQLKMTALKHDPLPALSLRELRDGYARLQQQVTDPVLAQSISVRLADLEILLAEQHQEQGTPTQKGSDGYFQRAINQYQSLLAQHPDNQHSAESLYQLAKAYELQGQMDNSYLTLDKLLREYPHNVYQSEVYFRKGEILYNRGDYDQAIAAYQQVLELGDNSPYYLTAAYMLGWANFKLDRQQQALVAFTALLDYSLPDDSLVGEVDSQQQMAQLGAGQRQLVNDTLRIMALLFSYQQGAASIAGHFASVGERHYESLLYQQLGQLYLNDDRFRDSADVFAGFVQQHPQHSQAPLFFVKQIDTYILGKFPTLVLPAKQRFVQLYGIQGPYWANWPIESKDIAGPYLHQYLTELAQYQHSLAQAKKQMLSTVDNEQLKLQTRQQYVQAFRQAASWYREFIQTFADDAQTTENWFLLAEALYEAGDYSQAIDAYEHYAYQLPQAKKAAEAGYAAILAYQQWGSVIDDSQTTGWQDKQLDSQIAFIMNFGEDPRAVAVLHDLVQQLFYLQRYQQAAYYAQMMIDWLPAVEQQRRLDSTLVLAHSQFALERYGLAEASYQQVLALLPLSDPRKADMSERLAASIYKQAEISQQQGYFPAAAGHFLRIVQTTPDTSIRVTAQYDLANALIELRDWSQAAKWLEDFRQRFPRHQLTASIDDKLIDVYQQDQQWAKAASELEKMWRANQDNETGRQALYVAAQYYHQIGQRDRALPLYREYAHRYPAPLAEANEARWQMSEYYLASNAASKRRYWLNKLIQAHAQAGNSASERSRYLAARSSLVLADDALALFNSIKLTLPLDQSLQRKNNALDKALAAYQQTASYKVAEFSTAATYHQGQIYARLAKDLLASERPKLNALELEQYGFLLEEQAYPFEDKAIEIMEFNTRLSWQGIYDQWVKQSFHDLETLLPTRYAKQELIEEVSDEIF
ncbi:tetratricopeptide repeat protein [Neptunicella sp. SCSIO 80796]|uniref:tetratricopeptide repeat protein n=1 Tax=Neptunicella plasticusilytica TaxID=3117012 RepID=UPI003A4E53F1